MHYLNSQGLPPASCETNPVSFWAIPVLSQHEILLPRYTYTIHYNQKHYWRTNLAYGTEAQRYQTFLTILEKHQKKAWHYNVIISKLLPSVSRDKSHPQAADELTRYMLIAGGKFIRTIRQYSLLSRTGKAIQKFWTPALWVKIRTRFLPAREYAIAWPLTKVFQNKLRMNVQCSVL